VALEIPLKPLYLFADSQLLFWTNGGEPFLKSVAKYLDRASPKAAYIGASNGDDPEYFSIFKAAMENIDISDCRMIIASFPPVDQAFVNDADIILLAGGDVEKGWKAFKETELANTIIKRRYEGAVLMGVSAGAVQLGRLGWSGEGDEAETFFHTFNQIPLIISAHDEDRDWKNLKRAVQFMGHDVRGIGIPMGAGLAYNPDQTIEILRRPLYEFSVRNDEIISSMLFPEGDPILGSPAEVTGQSTQERPGESIKG
jgi:cyanophycinase